MAKTNGIVKIEGTVEGLTFYTKDGQSFVRKKGGVSKERIMNDPNYVRTRENGSEFGHSASTAKQLRMALGSLVFKAKDSKLSSRMLEVLSRVKNLDTSSIRGERKVSIGLTTAEGKQALKNFDFNGYARLRSVLYQTFALDAATGTITFTDLIPVEHIRVPQGATHFSMQNAVLLIDFDTDVSQLEVSTVVNLPIGVTPVSFALAPAAFPTGTGTTFYLLQISFYQEVNGVQYSLKNEEYNVLNIVEVL